MTAAPIHKIAITSEGPSLADPVDARFGRAGGFVMVDLESMATTYVDNGSSQVLAQGAGIQAAENLVKAGAQALLTGHVGPKAWTALQATGVKVVQGVENMTVGEAVTKFKAGLFAFSDAPSR
jgi:predicted Fe-Mo cluster-binding NifX family protein